MSKHEYYACDRCGEKLINDGYDGSLRRSDANWFQITATRLGMAPTDALEEKSKDLVFIDPIYHLCWSCSYHLSLFLKDDETRVVHFMNIKED